MKANNSGWPCDKILAISWLVIHNSACKLQSVQVGGIDTDFD